MRQRTEQAGLTNVSFLQPVGRSQMPALTQSADLGYIGLQKRDLFKYGVSPNKLYEYRAAGLPILFAIEMDRDEAAEARCGFSLPAEDPAALAALLR